MTTDLSVDVQVASAASSVPADDDIRTWIASVLSQLDFDEKAFSSKSSCDSTDAIQVRMSSSAGTLLAALAT